MKRSNKPSFEVPHLVNGDYDMIAAYTARKIDQFNEELRSMEYHAIVLNNMATIRKADHGTSAREFNMGARILKLDNATSRQLAEHLKENGYQIMSIIDWNKAIYDEEPVFTNYKSREQVRDETNELSWDTRKDHTVY